MELLLKGNHFEKSPFQGNRLEYVRLMDEIETNVRCSVGNDWWEDYLSKTHLNEKCTDKGFIPMKEMQMLVEGQALIIDGRELVVTAAMARARKETRTEIAAHNTKVHTKTTGMGKLA